MPEASLIETKSAELPDDTASDRQRRLARRYRPRRTTADRLREALIVMCRGQADVICHEETPWASITFEGTRHEITLAFAGSEAVAAGEEFIAELSEHEFRIPGQLVADASVREVDHRFGAQERLEVKAVLLLLEES